jgi:hypothetical protein
VTVAFVSLLFDWQPVKINKNKNTATGKIRLKIPIKKPSNFIFEKLIIDYTTSNMRKILNVVTRSQSNR